MPWATCFCINLYPTLWQVSHFGTNCEVKWAFLNLLSWNWTRITRESSSSQRERCECCFCSQLVALVKQMTTDFLKQSTYYVLCTFEHNHSFGIEGWVARWNFARAEKSPRFETSFPSQSSFPLHPVNKNLYQV